MARPLGATADACWRHHGGATVHARETSFVQNDFDDNNEEDGFDDNNNFDEFDDNNNFDEFDDNNKEADDKVEEKDKDNDNNKDDVVVVVYIFFHN